MARFSKASVVLLKTQENKRLLERLLLLSDNVARPSYSKLRKCESKLMGNVYLFFSSKKSRNKN